MGIDHNNPPRRGRAFTRHQLQRAKSRARYIMTRIMWFCRPDDGEPPPKTVGRMASVHCVPCSCEMCGNPRHSTLSDGMAGLTIQERRAFQEDE